MPPWKRLQPVKLFFLFLGLTFLCLLPIGCATDKRESHADLPPSALGWPPPPDAPRICYIQSITRPADVGIKSSGFGHFASWITGANEANQQLIRPFGIALDEHDNLCVTDTAMNAVFYFDRAKKKWRRWDALGKLRFASPVAIAKRQDVFYVADSGLARILAFSESGKLLFQITNRLERPSGLTIHAGRLFVADSRRHCVVSFDLLGNYLSEFGRRGAGPGEFNFPSHISADAEGNLFITDSMNGRVQMLDVNGKFRAQIGSIGDRSGHFSRPKGVAADPFGNVYVVDALFDNIQVFDRTGQLLLYLGEAGADPGEFWLANGIAISRSGEIYVTDSYNHRVQVFRYMGAP